MPDVRQSAGIINKIMASAQGIHNFYSFDVVIGNLEGTLECRYLKGSYQTLKNLVDTGYPARVLVYISDQSRGTMSFMTIDRLEYAPSTGNIVLKYQNGKVLYAALLTDDGDITTETIE